MSAHQQPGEDDHQMPDGPETGDRPTMGQDGAADTPMPGLEADYDPASGMPRALKPPAGGEVGAAEAIEPPERRRCATVEVHERLLATVP